jgi:hypothetical protein
MSVSRAMRCRTAPKRVGRSPFSCHVHIRRAERVLAPGSSGIVVGRARDAESARFGSSRLVIWSHGHAGENPRPPPWPCPGPRDRPRLRGGGLVGRVNVTRGAPFGDGFARNTRGTSRRRRNGRIGGSGLSDRFDVLVGRIADARRPRSYNRTPVLCITRGQPPHGPWTTGPHAVENRQGTVDRQPTERGKTTPPGGSSVGNPQCPSNNM